jgi:16S rRNA (guanine966-N2)-methyltransferase
MPGLRVISGKAKGKRLASVPGDTTRPITDRTKESLFNILGADVEESIFLDLFGGTGSVGIEALSRGASFARFLDIARQAVETIRKNLETTGFSQAAVVSRTDAFHFLQQPPDRQYDYIYIAPPQYKELWKKAVLSLDANPGWLSEGAWVIVQIHPLEYAPVVCQHLLEFDQRKYGSTVLVFYEQVEQKPLESV